MAQLNVNLQEVEAQEKLNPIPPGWYNAEIVDSEIKVGAKGDYILWTFQAEGYPNKIWEIMSLNQNGEAVGLKKLKTLAVCSGHPDPNFIRDTEELHGKRCQIRVKIEEDETGTYDPKNKVTAYKPLNGKSAQAAAPKAATPPPVQKQADIPTIDTSIIPDAEAPLPSDSVAPWA